MLTVFDVETTGFKAGANEMIEISALVFDEENNFEFVSEFNSLVQPRRLGLIDPKAMEVNQIKLEDLMQAPTSEAVRGTFLEWWADLGIGKVRPAGWNYQFDRDFLRIMFGEAEYDSLFYYKAVDAYSIASFCQFLELIPKSLDLSLAEVTRELGITHKPHGARSDTYATWQVIKTLTEKLS